MFATYGLLSLVYAQISHKTVAPELDEDQKARHRLHPDDIFYLLDEQQLFDAKLEHQVGINDNTNRLFFLLA